MQEIRDWRTGRHAVFELYAHLVFTPKYRRKVFTETMLRRLEEVMKEQCLLLGGALLEFNGERDHIHLLVTYPAKVSVSLLAKNLKGVSARILRQEFWNEIRGKLWGDHFWSPSYCAVSAGGAPLEVIKKYIEMQDRPSSETQLRMQAVVQERWKKNATKRACDGEKS